MSHIATALAKSQGRDVKLPPGANIDDVPLVRVGPVANPFLQTVATKQVAPLEVAPPSAATARKFSVRPLLLALGALALLVLGLVTWSLLQGGNPLASFLPGAAPAAASASATPVTRPKAAPRVLPAEGPSDALREKVRGLVITAAAGGSIQRITVAGKVLQPGDTVIDGLILQAIEAEEIVFRDTAGHLYTRHR